jgi:very-short-patch-repair endonuclease
MVDSCDWQYVANRNLLLDSPAELAWVRRGRNPRSRRPKQTQPALEQAARAPARLLAHVSVADLPHLGIDENMSIPRTLPRSFRRITARGYRVKTQYRVGRYRIDLVIVGRAGRLAAELDGDAYHGPDRWEADRQRQAILERLDRTFHRIRGSAYYSDSDAALISLWERLDSLGIQPSPTKPQQCILPQLSTEQAKAANR